MKFTVLKHSLFVAMHLMIAYSATFFATIIIIFTEDWNNPWSNDTHELISDVILCILLVYGSIIAYWHIIKPILKWKSLRRISVSWYFLLFNTYGVFIYLGLLISLNKLSFTVNVFSWYKYFSHTGMDCRY